MALASLTYHPPIARHLAPPTLDYELYEQAVALAESGDPTGALGKTLQHLFPDREILELAVTPFEFSQGSSQVTISVHGDDLRIAVPFVALPSGGRAIAALRFVLSRISCTGQLYQPVLRGDDLTIEYTDRLSRLHPAKIIEVLRKMPREADDFDDLVVAEFGATPLRRAPIASLEPTELERADGIWATHWTEIDELLKECRRKRSAFFLNELSAYATNRLFFALPLIGIVATRLNEAASSFNDTDEDPSDREAALATCLKEMRALSSDTLHASLGFATYGVSPRRRGTPALIHRYFCRSQYMASIDERRQSSHVMDAALALTSAYLFLLSRYAWPHELEDTMKQALQAASGKPWREAAALLYEHAKTIGEKYGKDDDAEHDDADEEADASSEVAQ